MRDKIKAAIRRKRYYQNHREELLAYAKDYRRTHKKAISDKQRAYYRKYLEENKERLKNYRKQYNLAHAMELSEKRKVYKEAHKDEIKIGKLQHYFRLSKEEASLLYYKKLNGVCDICGNPESSKRFLLSVDHNHKTNKIRGLLCGSCNKGLGGFKDDASLLQKAIIYLKGENYVI